MHPRPGPSSSSGGGGGGGGPAPPRAVQTASCRAQQSAPKHRRHGVCMAARLHVRARALRGGATAGWDWVAVAAPAATATAPESSLPLLSSCVVSVAALRPSVQESTSCFPGCYSRYTTPDHRQQLMQAVAAWLRAGTGAGALQLGCELSPSPTPTHDDVIGWPPCTSDDALTMVSRPQAPHLAASPRGCLRFRAGKRGQWQHGCAAGRVCPAVGGALRHPLRVPGCAPDHPGRLCPLGAGPRARAHRLPHVSRAFPSLTRSTLTEILPMTRMSLP
jgi:hypothetical protein